MGTGRVLISGGGGFVGRRLCASLSAQGTAVVAPAHGEWDIVTGEVPAGPFDHVFHLAALSGVPDSWQTPERFFQVNVAGTFRVLEYCRASGCPLTYLSGYVYGIPDALPISEHSPARPNNPYALTKRMAEEACRFYAEHYRLDVTVLRPFNIYGPGQSTRFLIPRIIEQALNPDVARIEVLDLAPARDFVFVEDVVEAILLTAARRGYSLYNVGSGTSHSVQDVISAVENASGVRKPVASKAERRRDEIMDVVADVTAIRVDVGWTPRTLFGKGIALTVAAARHPC